jgi:GPI inositol-deacylase
LASRRPSMEASLEVQRSRQSRLRDPWSCSVWTLSVAAVGIISLLSIVYAFVHRDVGAAGCDVPVMSPTYIKMVGFDAEHTRFASKYNLYLYREEGFDSYGQDDFGVCYS